MRQRLRALLEPIPRENRQILAERWGGLPPELQTPAQALGRHLPHCGFVLGPAYCSFGCTHCYLPRNANRAPLPTLEEMKAQVDANRRLLGHAGHLQITGGDVVDAYVRAGREAELLDIVRYTCDVGLIPMLMTHGQRLLENPQLLEDLVVRAGLRNVALHIDVTQAGRPGFPRRELTGEADLHPLRQQFADLVLDVRARTGKGLTAA
ncbi:MAG: radical SAM protein, partial [Acidobacteriota bacterium]